MRRRTMTSAVLTLVLPLAFTVSISGEADASAASWSIDHQTVAGGSDGSGGSCASDFVNGTGGHTGLTAPTTQTSSASFDGTNTNKVNNADSVRLQQTSADKLVLAGTAAHLSSITYNVAQSGLITGTDPSTCLTSGNLSAAFGGPVTLSKPQLVSMALVVRGGLDAQLVIVGATHQFVLQSAKNAASSSSGRVVLPAGTYSIQGGASSNVASDPGLGFARTISGSVSASISFADPGAAVGPSRGPSGFVALNAARNCAAGTLGAKFGSRAKSATKAKVVLNGRVVKVVKAPKPTKTFSISIAPATAANVTVLFVRPGTDVKVSRSYLACSAG